LALNAPYRKLSVRLDWLEVFLVGALVVG